MLRKLFIFFVSMVAFTASWGQSIDTYIHPRAYKLIPIIKEEVDDYAPDLKSPWVIPAIIDKETCAGYKGYMCFNNTAELRVKCKGSDRLCEQGLGLGQMTRTWNANGTVRFDNLANL